MPPPVRDDVARPKALPLQQTGRMRDASSAALSVDDHLKALAAFEPGDQPVLSLYLDLRADQHRQDRYDAFVRKAFAERRRAMRGRPESDSVDQDLTRIEAFLKDAIEPSWNAVAVFACTAAGLFKTVELDVAVGGHWLFVGSTPHLYPLVRLLDQYPRYAAVLLDTHQARIFVFGLNTTEHARQVTGPKTRRTNVGGWSQARYQRRVQNAHVHHIRDVIDALGRIVAQEQLSQIVLAGHETALALLRSELPATLTEKVVDQIRLQRTTGERDVLEHTVEALRGKDADNDVEHVAAVLDTWRSGGLGVAGPEATLSALELGQVDEVLISATPTALKKVQTLPDEVIRLEADTSEITANDDTSKLALADEIATRAQQTGAHIRIVEDQTLLGEVGGVAAFLRFRL
jgi:stalled ribosome rescue protein Dom34